MPGILNSQFLRSSATATPVDVVQVDVITGANSKSCALGTSVAGRKIVVMSSSDNVTDDKTLTVDGNSATKFLFVSNGSECITGFYYDMGTGVTTGTVALTHSGTGSRTQQAVWAVYNAATGAPAQTATDTVGATSNVTLTTTTTGGAVGLAIMRTNAAKDINWTGLTIDTQLAIANSYMEGSVASLETTTTSLNITATPSSAGTRDPVLMTAAFSAA